MRWSVFAAHVAGFFVRAQPTPGGMAHQVIAGPFGEGDLADEFGADPVGVAGVPWRQGVFEWARGLVQRAEPLREIAQHGLGEAGADVPGVAQLAAAVVDAEQEGTDRA